MIRGEASTSLQSSWYVQKKREKEREREKLLWTARIEDKKEEPTGLTVTRGRNDNNTR